MLLYDNWGHPYEGPLLLVVYYIPINKATGIIEYANNLPFLNTPMQKMLSERLDGKPVYMENDANAAAFGSKAVRPLTLLMSPSAIVHWFPCGRLWIRSSMATIPTPKQKSARHSWAMTPDKACSSNAVANPAYRCCRSAAGRWTSAALKSWGTICSARTIS